MKQQTIYISGPMRGYRDYNFPAFERAEALLFAIGHIPISPHRLDEADGWTLARILAEGSPTGAAHEMIVRRDVEAVFACDAVCTLKGWQNSIGARAEIALAHFLMKPVIPLEP